MTCENPSLPTSGPPTTKVFIPCGKCPACVKEKPEWERIAADDSGNEYPMGGVNNPEKPTGGGEKVWGKGVVGAVCSNCKNIFSVGFHDREVTAKIRSLQERVEQAEGWQEYNAKLAEKAQETIKKAEEKVEDLEEAPDYECDSCGADINADEGAICPKCWTHDILAQRAKRAEEKAAGLQAQLAGVVEYATKPIPNTSPTYCRLCSHNLSDGHYPHCPLSSLPDPPKGQVLVDKETVDFYKQALEIRHLEMKNYANDLNINADGGVDIFIAVGEKAKSLQAENDRLLGGLTAIWLKIKAILDPGHPMAVGTERNYLEISKIVQSALEAELEER